MVEVETLKAPFPAFGGKSSIADDVWTRFGDVDALTNLPVGAIIQTAEGLASSSRSNPNRCGATIMAEVNSSTEIEYCPTLKFDGYRVGSDGSVWTIKSKGGNDRKAGKRADKWRRLAVAIDRKGYHAVTLCVDGKTIGKLVHHLVLEAFVGPRPEGMDGCHYPDPDKGNNAVANLRWDSHAENIKDKYRDRGPVTEKTCRRCKQVKPAQDFYRDTRASDGLKTECKKCHCAIAYATADKSVRRENNRNFMRRKKVLCKSN